MKKNKQQVDYSRLVLEMASALGHKNVSTSDPGICALIMNLEQMDLEGYNISKVPASFELLVRDALGIKRRFFTAISYDLMDRADLVSKAYSVKAIVELDVAGERVMTATPGIGPVDALSNALLKALSPSYSELEDFRLVDFSEKVINGDKGTASRVRVITEYANLYGERWCAVGVSENSNMASWEAVVTSLIYGLIRSDEDSLTE